jgi:NAD(P)-dependent dehydrogenase (short-subunit alcohol dehydrogenase family)
MNEKKIWFITGASKGLGLTLVKKLLADGFQVAATSRNLPALIQEISNKSEDFLPLEVDIVNEASVKNAVDKTLEHFGKIDVLVNNAGYGQFGTLEELSDREARLNFDVNVFGVLNVVRSVMSHFRTQSSGHFFNISSIGGYTAGFPGAGIYCATKFAVAALTESLAAEAKAFGVKATIVYPGYFRTDFLSQDSIGVPENPIAEYEEARKLVNFHQNQMNGNQQGDPEKLATVLIQMSKEENPALHLFLGQDAYDAAYAKIEEVKTDLEHWKKETISTSFD